MSKKLLLSTCFMDLTDDPYGAVHKTRHQSRGRGVFQKMILLNKLSKSDDEGGRGGQKSIDDVFYERPLTYIDYSKPSILESRFLE